MGRNILFCGFGGLGTQCLNRLINEGYNILYILTHKESANDSVDTFAKLNNIEFSYGDSRREKIFSDSFINNIKLDFIISINYRYILPKQVIQLAQYAINIHGSLLPKYRGRTPHVWSIINGEDYTGVTCHLIDEGIDTGNIIEQVVIKINDTDTGYSLLEKFISIYPNILIDSLNKLQKGFETIKQKEEEASYYGKRTPEMGYIDFYKTKKQIINFVRAQAYPYPGAYYYLPNGRKIIINLLAAEQRADIIIHQIGIIKLIDNCYYVRCEDGILKLLKYEIVN